MLNYIKNMLPYPYTGVANIIYSIADTVEFRQQVKYNGKLDQFEIPLSALKEKNYQLTTSVCLVTGTSIYYYVDIQDNFCFGIDFGIN